MLWIASIPIMWACMALGHYIINSTTLRRKTSYKEAKSLAQESFAGIKAVASFNMQRSRKKMYVEALERDKVII